MAKNQTPNTISSSVTAVDLAGGISNLAQSATKLDNALEKKLSDIIVSQNSILVANEILTVTSKGVEYSTEYLDSLLRSSKFSEKVKNISSLGDISSALEGIKGVNSVLSISADAFGVINAILVLNSENTTTSEKIAASLEITNKIAGNVTNTVTQIMVAQRIAAGMPITAPVIGLIVSSLSLAVSPLRFYNAAKKFDNSNKAQEAADKFKKYGYTGDELLANFYKEYGAVEVSTATVSTALGMASAGIGAAAAGSLVTAPVALIIGGFTGVISGIVESSKQYILENLATKYQKKILDWEANNPGNNYFDNGYDSRYSHLLEENIVFLNELAREMGTKSLAVITQQGWDPMLGELAAITREGSKISSGKVYAESIYDGNILKDAKDITMDVDKGTIILDSKSSSQTLTFLTPLMTSTSESRVRIQTGKNTWLTQLSLGNTNDWIVTDNGNTSTVADFSNIVQRIVFKNNNINNVTLTANMGSGDDTIYVGHGTSVINAGDGFDTVSYSRSSAEWTEIKAVNEKSGDYDVTRHVNSDVYYESISSQSVNIGKNTEHIEYRNVSVKKDTYDVKDKLRSVEQIIGTNGRDLFYGGEQIDYFYGGDEIDAIHGGKGNDFLYGGNDDDSIWGDDGNDFLIGGVGNDNLYGGQGNDFILYSKDEGHDHIYEDNGIFDLLNLEGIKSSDLCFYRSGNNLEMTVKNSIDKITFENWYYYESINTINDKNRTDMKIEAIRTSDGKIITYNRIDSLIASISTQSFNVSDVEESIIFDENLTNMFTATPVF